ncbi:MAG: ribonuclease Y [Mollicutes bacterium]|nr:MAG: ribonuclease Y [Mollicutes bacterium]
MDTLKLLLIILIPSALALGIFLTVFIDTFLFFLTRQKRNKILKGVKKESEFYVNKINAEKNIEFQKRRDKLEDDMNIQKVINIKTNTFLKNKENEIEIQERKLKSKLINIDSIEEKLLFSKKNLEKEQERIIKELEKISGLSKKKAEEELFKNIEKNQIQKIEKLTKDKVNELNQNLQDTVNNIIATAIERYASEFINEKTTTKIDLGDEKLKGKIIGKEGRNIKSFEELSGVDIIIENDSNIIRLSSFNPVRREIAMRALKKLIDDGRIQPQRIEEFLEIEKKNVDLIIAEAGKNTVRELGITDLDPELINQLGKLKFRTSYGQNVLQHSIEVAKISGAMAKELNLNDRIAVRCGLLHDIGKSLDYEIERSHVELGVDLAQKYQESDYVINAIHSHHGDIPANNIYSLLISASDTISASRPGARDNVHEDYLKRLEIIEKVCNQIEGVQKSYAVKSGRVIRVFVDPLVVGDHETNKIAETIQKELRTQLKVPGEVVIKIIREYRIEKII